MFFRTASVPLAQSDMSERDARGPEEHEPSIREDADTSPAKLGRRIRACLAALFTAVY